MLKTINIQIKAASYPLLQDLVQQYGRQVSSSEVPRCGYSDTVYRINAPVTACTPSSLTIGGFTIQATVTRLTPEEQQALPGCSPLIFPKTEADFSDLARQEGREFAYMLQATLDELRANRACYPLPLVTKFQPDRVYAYSGQNKRGQGKQWFLSLSFDVSLSRTLEPKSGVFGIDAGFTTPFIIAPSDDIDDVQSFSAPAPLAQWMQSASLRSATQWDLARQAFYYATLPAFRYCAAARAVFLEDLSFGKYMDRDYVQRMRLSGLIDTLMINLPFYLELSGTDVTFVPPVGTSTTCHICRRPGQRRGKQFICTEHGTFDADANASLVIRAGGVIGSWDESRWLRQPTPEGGELSVH